MILSWDVLIKIVGGTIFFLMIRQVLTNGLMDGRNSSGNTHENIDLEEILEIANKLISSWN